MEQMSFEQAVLTVLRQVPEKQRVTILKIVQTLGRELKEPEPAEETFPVPPTPPLLGNEEEWQKLIETTRQSEPYFPTLDEAMNFSRRRS